MIAFLALLLGTSVLPHSQLDDCDSRMRGQRTSIHGDTDDEHSFITYVKIGDGRCESATIIGKLTYSPDEDDVVSIPFGGSLTLRERNGGEDRAMNFTRGADGQVVRSYQRNGRGAEYDADARRWVSAFLPRILASAGVNVDARVARWRERGGVDNVLKNIEGLASSGGMRAHYEALLNGPRLSDSEMESTLRSVSDNMRGSSGDLRSVLSRLLPTRPLGARALGAFQSALMSIPSSGDKAGVVLLYGPSANREMLLGLTRAAETIPSSGDKSRVLIALASRYLEHADHDLVRQWFRVAESIPSSGDLRNVFMSVMPYASSSEVTREIIEGARNIPSSGDRSAVLLSLVRQGNLRDSAVRNAFMDATSSIPSDGDKARVLQAFANLR